MVTVKRVMEANGWTLVGGWMTLVGDLHEAHDIWEIEDAILRTGKRFVIAGALAAGAVAWLATASARSRRPRRRSTRSSRLTPGTS